MSEKIKGMFGHPERAEEVRNWLLSQGAVNDTMIECKNKDAIYYVDNYKMAYLLSLQGKYNVLFDIVELPKPECKFKPFDRVLVRVSETDVWVPSLYGFYRGNEPYPHVMIGGCPWKYCIPHEGNEHLVGTLAIKNPEEE